MSILSDINKVINDTDMLLWYKEDYIPFVIDHIDDIVETTQSPGGICYYMAYIPLDYHPNDVSCTRETCIEWLLNNDKIQRVESIDDAIDGKYCYSGDFLKDSNLFTHIFNACWLKTMYTVDANSKNYKNYYWTIDSMPNLVDMELKPHSWTMKVDYSKNMNYEFAKVYCPIS